MIKEKEEYDVLFVIKAKPIGVDFFAAQIEEENDTEYKVIDKIGVDDNKYIHTFPKNLIEKEFEDGFVTDRANKEILLKQLERVNEIFQLKTLKAQIDELNNSKDLHDYKYNIRQLYFSMDNYEKSYHSMVKYIEKVTNFYKEINYKKR